MLNRVATVGSALIFVLVLAGGFLGLKTWCSSEEHLPNLGTPWKPDGGKGNPEHSSTRQQDSSPEGEQAKPAATFDLRLSESNKIEGRYYTEKPEKEDWGHKFFCDFKIGEALLSVFTFFLVLYTARLYVATARLAEADRPHMLISEMTARGITSPPAEDGKVTILLEHKFINYGRSPAFLRNFCLQYTTNELVNAPTYQTRTPTRFIIAVSSWYGSIKPSELTIDAAEIREVLLGNKTIQIYGRIEYSGLGESPHVHRFAYALLFESGDASVRFYPTGPDSYWENT
jgi:hypothetical protein